MKLDRKTFDQQRSPRFGQTNPQRMRLAFWEAMVQDGQDPYRLRERFITPQSSFAWTNSSGNRIFGSFRMPVQVLVSLWKDLISKLTRRQSCQVNDAGPIWCFDRMGQTRTALADGRTVCMGGEHEDHYDPDFFIYNDVVIIQPDDEVEIYGYPKDVFPPTDFHTASLVDGRIIIIGCLGYPDDRRPGFTPVQSLDLTSYRIEPIATQGEPPGWIFKHEAQVDPSGDSINIRGGEIIENRDGEQVIRLNLEEYRLRLVDQRWERLTNRRTWRQFEIRRVEDGLLLELPDLSNFQCGDVFPKYGFDEEVFQPASVPHEPLSMEEHDQFGLVVNDVTIRVMIDAFLVRMIVEGDLPTILVERAVEEIRQNIEAAIEAPCVVKEF